MAELDGPADQGQTPQEQLAHDRRAGRQVGAGCAWSCWGCRTCWPGAGSRSPAAKSV